MRLHDNSISNLLADPCCDQILQRMRVGDEAERCLAVERGDSLDEMRKDYCLAGSRKALYPMCARELGCDAGEYPVLFLAQLIIRNHPAHIRSSKVLVPPREGQPSSPH